MSKNTLPKWNEDREAVLIETVGTNYDVEVSVNTVKELAESLETTPRSVSSKLRKMGYTVESTAAAAKKVYSEKDEENIRTLLEENPGKYTYAEVAAYILDDPDKAKSIQGKILAMELTDLVKKVEPKVVPKKYTEAEEAKVLEMMEAGSYLEDIAEALGKSINSIRGKCLSINKESGVAIPKQKESHAKVKADAFESLDSIGEMTVAEIAEALDKTERGVKSMLTHRGITCANYDGAKKAEKNAAKRASA